MMKTGEAEDRVVLHFDVDAMYVACERELNQELRGVPVGVCQ
jgi:nucleotidyltransferase/DNA polymerase involved in DNA repair